MKKKFAFLAIGISVVVSIVFFYDLFTNTNHETGFLVSGSVVPRYISFLVVGIIIAGLCFLGKKQIATSPIFTKPFCIASLLCFVGSFLACICQLFLFTMQQVTVLMVVISIVFLLGSFWFLGLGLQKKSVFLFGGVFVVANIVSIVQTFLTMKSSLHRIEAVAEIITLVFAMLFLDYLLKTIEMPNTKSKPVFFNFLSAMCFTTSVCIYLPLQLWELATNKIEFYPAFKTFWLVPVGILALVLFLQTKNSTSEKTTQNLDAPQ